MTQSTPFALLLLGSHRQNGNTDGIASWFSALWASRAGEKGSAVSLQSSRSLTGDLPPEGPVFDPTIPAMVTDVQGYADPAVRAWSTRVRDSSAVVILTPQYNWGYPGSLKNSIDHLFSEWKGKPILLITFGGHGGTRCAEGLKIVIEGIHAHLVQVVNITLPSEFIRKQERVQVDLTPNFLKSVEDEVSKAIDLTLEAAGGIISSQ